MGKRLKCNSSGGSAVRNDRLPVARRLLDVMTDDRLLAEKTGLGEAEARALRKKDG